MVNFLFLDIHLDPSRFFSIFLDTVDLISILTENLNLDSKLPYARNRTVESYLWALGAHFEPCYSQARIKLAQIIILLTVVDDTYDAYGTIEELESFTDAFLRWNSSGTEGLPKSMRYLHGVVLDFFDKIEEEMEQSGKSGCGSIYARKAMMTSVKAYIQEAKWLNEGYVATLEECKENGILSACYLVMVIMSILGTVDEGTLDVLEWLSTFSPLLVQSSLIARFADDIVSSEFEHKRKHVATTIDCYMKQYGVSSEKAKEEVKVMVLDLWKSLNRELMRPHQFPFSVLMRLLNLSRVMEVFYKKNDMFTNSDLLKDYVASLFLDKIPI